MKYIQFTLSMPRNNSWNGKWTGGQNLYAIVKKLTDKSAERVLASQYHSYSFGDGWVAAVDVKEIDGATSRKVRKASKGFCGYDWMVDNIVYYGNIKGKEAA